MKKQYLIGEFSEVTGISKRMLRHYDKINLFSPFEINEENGYRYYNEAQIEDLEKIQFLNKLGFTLASIADILSEPIGLVEFVELLKDKEVTLTKDSDDIKSSLLMAKRMITLLEQQSPKAFPSIYKLLDWERSITMNNVQSIKRAKVDLKGLMNRDMFMEKIEEILKTDQNDDYHFITFDIDNFMQVNDDDGYDVGDLVIQNIFSMIINNMKSFLDENPAENLLSRLGGDECSVFLKNPDKSKVIKCIEMIFDEVRAFDFKSIGCSKQMTITSGAVCGKKPNHFAEFKDKSVKALMEAKRNGKDQFILKNY